MKKISTKIKINSKEFIKNKHETKVLLDQIAQLEQVSRAPEKKEDIEKLSSKQKLTTSERIAFLKDSDAEILEIATLAGLNCYEGVPPGSGVYACITRVSSKECVVIANIPSVKGGTYYPMTVKKHLRALEIAYENKLPVICLVDSGGAYLPLQDQVFPDKDHFGGIFFKQAQLSKSGIPQIAAVLGLCTAGGAYVPAMSEQVVMVDGNSTIFLGGPQLVQAATGEIVTAEELGGARVHTDKSGVSDYLEPNEQSALSKVRNLIAHIPTVYSKTPLVRNTSPTLPAYDPEELHGICGSDIRKPISAMEIIARIVDSSLFEEFKPRYGKTLKCGFAHIEGYLVGIICNDGILFGESALKATHFISLCEQRRIPLIFLQNIVGFMVGTEYEHAGIAKHGAKMVTAVSTTTVPKYTIICGGSYGAGNYGMCGRAYHPRFLFTWPHSRISVMGGTQAAEVLLLVKKSSGKASADEIEKLKSQIEKEYFDKGNALYASSQLWDDGIIDPKRTRSILGRALRCAHIENAHINQFGIFRM